MEKFKIIVKKIIQYVKDYPIFALLNIIFFLLVIFGFKTKALLGFLLIILWLLLIIAFIKSGGYAKMIKKKKGLITKSSKEKNTIIEEKRTGSKMLIKKAINNDDRKINKIKKETIKKDKKTIEELRIEGQDKNKKGKKKKKHKVLKFFLNFFLVSVLLVLVLSVVFAIYIVVEAPDFNPENLYRAESSIIYDKDGNQITKLGIEKRKKVSYDDLPQILIDAIVATEDSRYFQHNGFDLPRFAKASFGQIISKLTHRGDPGGGSTLSMQVVKNNFTDVEQTIKRKFTDIYLAIFKLEKNYSKEEILEYYVNTPFLGNGSYGVEQACQSYFGKSVSDINLAEAAIIAGLFQAPSAYDPYRFPEATEERRETVLYLMKTHGYITEEEEKLANSIPVKSLIKSSNPEVQGNEFQSFIDVVIDEVEEKTGKSPYTTGMKIYTTLDTGKQRVLNDIMNGVTWTWKDDLIQAGVGVVDTQSGAILAIGGGRGRSGERQYNYATMIQKQIGSTAKPIFDYGPAIEYNNFCLTTPFNDAPYTYSSGGSLKNWDFSFQGVETLKRALAESRNIPAVKAFQSVENSKIKEFVTNLGMTPEIDSEGKLHEAHALGAFTGTNPVQLAGAYAAFGNGGYFTKPYSVNKVEFIDNNKTVSLKGKKTKVMEDSTAYMITDTLVYAVESYGNIGGTVWGVKLAAKTGTTNLDSETIARYNFPSNAVNDMWTAGYTPEISVALWYGYDKLVEGYYNVWGNVKNELYRQIIDSLSNREAKQTFDVPSSVVKVSVERETYPVAKPSANTPSDMIVTDYCRVGTEPTTVSPRYNKLENVSGLSSKVTDETVTLSWKEVGQPAFYSPENFKKYYEVLYAQHIDEKLAEFQANNGTFGYQIIERNHSTGVEKEIDFVTGNSVSFKRPSYDATYTVRTRYKNLEATASPGVSVDVEGKITTIEIDPKDYDVSFSDGKDTDTATFDGTNATLANVSDNVVVTDKNGDPVKDYEKNITCKAVTPDTNTCSVSSDLATFSDKGTYSIGISISIDGTRIDTIYKEITVN
ncbi:MAG: transglycosylase domain-containing protein [Bacilli bacterium]|nr:transglycosylase domain-containing protein [Bacilli bacterium]